MSNPLSLQAFLLILLRRWVLVVGAAVIGGAAAYAATAAIAPTYTATATQLVKGLPGAGVAANYEAAQFSVSRAKSYPSFIYSAPVLTGVKTDLNGTVELNQLRQQLSAVNPTDTPLVVISAEAGSPAEARDMANSAATHLAKFVEQIEGVSGRSPIEMEIAVEAGLPTSPTSPNKPIFAALGMIVGFVVASAVALYLALRRGRGPRRAQVPVDAGVGADTPQDAPGLVGTLGWKPTDAGAGPTDDAAVDPARELAQPGAPQTAAQLSGDVTTRTKQQAASSRSRN